MNINIELKLKKLSKSKFRNKFHITGKDREYIKEKGIDVIKQHAENIITRNLKKKIKNDGRQTPYRGHPVFVAQHATATCCRKCMYKWYNILPFVELDEHLIKYFTDVIMGFLENELSEIKKDPDNESDNFKEVGLNIMKLIKNNQK